MARARWAKGMRFPMRQTEWLSEEELVFYRMVTFHRERVEAVAANTKTLSKLQKGILIIHLIPQQCVIGRSRFESTKLKEHGIRVCPLGERGSNSRFNVDGLRNSGGRDEVRAYSQIYRDGRVEAVMSDAAYPHDRQQEQSGFVLRDIICEKGAIDLVRSYLVFCKAMEIAAPIWMFSALLDCEGVGFLTDRNCRDVSEHSIDRSPAFIPELEITALDTKVDSLLQPWCDSLWQTSGLERSWSYDEQANWHERR